jgi:hypothetical protein
MVKQWVVRNTAYKGTHIRKDPLQDKSAGNVLAVVPNGEVVFGEFMLIRRASRELGFVKARHLLHQCGRSWAIRNAEGSAATLVRKQPHEAYDSGNTVGYANEGEHVDSEFVFVNRALHQNLPSAAQRGGFVKLRHLKEWKAKVPKPFPDVPPVGIGSATGSAAGTIGSALTVVASSTSSSGAHVAPVAGLTLTPQEFSSSSAPSEKASSRSSLVSIPDSVQKWLVMDSSHDGAWLRKLPRSDRGQENVIRLVPNGDIVAGEFLHVRRRSGEAGYVKFHNLVEEPGGRSWRVRCTAGSTVSLNREPREACDPGKVIAHAKEGETVEGEFVYVYHKMKRAGHIKRRHLSAMAFMPK